MADLQDSQSAGDRSNPTTRECTTIHELIRIILLDPNSKPEEKKLLIDEVRKNNPGASDRWTYRYAILLLGGAVLLTIMALWYLSQVPGISISDGLVSIGSAAVGGLAGLLTPGRSSEG
jgi:hypothetical protein